MAPTLPDTERVIRTASRRLPAMGTEVLFTLDAAPGPETSAAFDAAERELDRLQRIFSRFDDASELCELERRRVLTTSDELRSVLEVALDARHRTGGRFDPTILPSLRALGYDRSIEHVRGTRRGGKVREHAPGVIAIHPTSGLVALGDGVAIDLGGIAKGWICDRLAELLAASAPALVDAGGDISCTPRLDGSPWVVALDDATPHTYLEFLAGGIATSGIDRRRWRAPDDLPHERHHVVDPATGSSAATDLLRVTAIAGSCATAEVAATAMLVGGSDSLTELGTTLDVSWLAIGIQPTRPLTRSKDLR